MNASISAERRGRLDAKTQERKTISYNSKTTGRTVFFPVLIGAVLLLASFHSPIIKARKSAAVWRRRTLRVRRRRRLPIQLLTKMLFPQLLCVENDPSFIGGVPPLNEKIMNSKSRTPVPPLIFQQLHQDTTHPCQTLQQTLRRCLRWKGFGPGGREMEADEPVAGDAVAVDFG